VNGIIGAGVGRCSMIMATYKHPLVFEGSHDTGQACDRQGGAGCLHWQWVSIDAHEMCRDGRAAAGKNCDKKGKSAETWLSRPELDYWNTGDDEGTNTGVYEKEIVLKPLWFRQLSRAANSN
jgi:hypothetical protein